MTLSTTQALTKISNAATTFLSSLQSGFEGASAGGSLFDHLLDGLKTSLPTTVDSKRAPASSDKTSTGASSQTSAAGGTGKVSVASTEPSADDVASAWRDFIAKWQSYKKSNSHTASDDHQGTKDDTQIAPDKTVASAASTVLAAAAAPVATASMPAMTSSSGTDTDKDNATSDTPVPSLKDLLAELQSVLQLVQQQLQNAKQSGAGNAGDTQAAANTDSHATTDINSLLAGLQAAAADLKTKQTAGSDDGAQAATKADTMQAAPQASAQASTTANPDLATTADMLAELFLLARFAEKKLGGNAKAATADAGAASANSSSDSTGASAPAPANPDAQLKADFKSLLDTVKSALATSNANTAQTQSVVAASTSPLTTTNNSADTQASAPDIVGKALTVADDFVKQLGFTPVSAQSAPPSTYTAAGTENTAASISAVAAAQNPADLGADSGQDDASANADAGSNATTNLAITADSAKTASAGFAEQLSATRATTPAGLPTAVEQVMMQLTRNAKAGNDQMTLQLHPVDLGKISIKLDFGSDGSVQGTVVAHNTDTLTLLQKDSRSLERALQDAGLRADPGSLQFSLGGQGDNSSNHASGQSSRAWGNGKSKGSSGADSVDAVDADAVEASETWILTPNRVNLTV